MKKNLFISLVCGLIACHVSEARADQSINAVKGNVLYSFPSSTAGSMTYQEGSSITIAGETFSFSEIDALKVLPIEIADNTVLVDYANTGATVYIAGNLSHYVSATVTEGHVSLIQSEEVDASTCGEVTYVLQGESEMGSFTLTGGYKATIELRGLTLTNPEGAAIDIQNGKRISFSVKNNTVNTLIDGTSGSQKAALYCKGHLELKGKGVLNVTGNTAHAISAKEYIEIKNCTINILSSVKDGINCNQYFAMESGEVNITNPGDDGIQVSFKDDTDREAEDTGSFSMIGGAINISDIKARSAKAIKCDGDFAISEGSITATSSASGEWDSAKAKTKASACIGADGNVIISGGALMLTATGPGGKGVSCDGNLDIDGGDIKINTSGNMLVYYGNKLYEGNYTGNTDRIESDAKSSPKGIKCDGEVTINGGDIFVTTTGTGAEGIESKSTLTINDGMIRVRAYDDGINSASHMYINGGTIDVISSKNDGLDSNGSIYISGGLVMAFGGASPECGLDANDEEGYTIYLTGGRILAAGGSNSYPRNSASTQPYVTVSTTLSASGSVSIGTASETFYTFTIPADYSTPSGGSGRPGGSSGSTVMISVPELTSGNSYTVKNGNSTLSATARLTGSSSGPGGRP